MFDDMFPEFYKQVPSITTYDPLAHILGSINDGIIKYRYVQIVKSAGHSCPTVAGAYLMTYKALEALYDDKYPTRGEIAVEFKEDENDGVAGVIGNVITDITGATVSNGFKGLGGRFSRVGLMKFNADINSSARFKRVDTGKSVDVYYNPSVVPSDPKMSQLMPKVISGTASEDEIKEFGVLWQDRVKRIMIDNFANSDMIKVI